MSTLGLTGGWSLFFGIYLVVHGLIHLIFTNYEYNSKNHTLTSWNGRSWLLDPLLSSSVVKLIGTTLWLLVVFLFVIAGMAVLGIPLLSQIATSLIIIAASLAIIGYFICFTGLSPTPYHGLIGLVVDLTLLLYVAEFLAIWHTMMIIFVGYAVLGMVLVIINQCFPGFLKMSKPVH